MSSSSGLPQRLTLHAMVDSMVLMEEQQHNDEGTAREEAEQWQMMDDVGSENKKSWGLRGLGVVGWVAGRQVFFWRYTASKRQKNIAIPEKHLQQLRQYNKNITSKQL